MRPEYEISTQRFVQRSHGIILCASQSTAYFASSRLSPQLNSYHVRNFFSLLCLTEALTSFVVGLTFCRRIGSRHVSYVKRIIIRIKLDVLRSFWLSSSQLKLISTLIRHFLLSPPKKRKANTLDISFFLLSCARRDPAGEFTISSTIISQYFSSDPLCAAPIT